MMLDVKRTLMLSSILVAALAYTAPLLAQEAGAGGADLDSVAGAATGGAADEDAGAAGAPASGHAGGSGGSAGKPTVIGGSTSYDLLENNSGHACSMGHSGGTADFGVLAGVTVALVLTRRRRGHKTVR